MAVLWKLCEKNNDLFISNPPGKSRSALFYLFLALPAFLLYDETIGRKQNVLWTNSRCFPLAMPAHL